jgi:hypothetical protein
VTGSQGTLFDERFLGRYAGAIMSDPTTALVELVANAWDAYATKVKIQWPDRETGTAFGIEDNGLGMSAEEFEIRWRTLDYNRLSYQGETVMPPAGVQGGPRPVYGRNGKGRHAAFYFSSPYRVRTWKDGVETVYRVSQGISNPIDLEQERRREGVTGHGTEISALAPNLSALSAADARSLLSTRFLANPAFEGSVDGVKVTFDDIPGECLQEIQVEVPGCGVATIRVIDSQRADRTSKQHGIAWWVNNRLVGTAGWRYSDEVRIVDGRSEEAKRYTFIVSADFLAPAVQEDWRDFRPGHPAWVATERPVQEAIRGVIHNITREKRTRTRDIVRASHRDQVIAMPLLSRERWNGLLDNILENCPSLGESQVDQVMGLLAKLELAQSQYSLLEKLHALTPNEMDQWNSLLNEWTVATAKIALDEVAKRLRLIEEIRAKTSDSKTDEVQDLQPLFARSLWIFGPQFESIEFTSNQGMTQVIKTIFHKDEKGSLNRPDFVITTDGSVGLYATPAYDSQHNEVGTSTLVIVDLKRPGVSLGMDEKNQVWKYVKELRNRGHITEDTYVIGHVLGDRISQGESIPMTQGDRCTIKPLLYANFVSQAEKRMLTLHKKLLSAPFMQEVMAAFVAPPDGAPVPKQGTLAVNVVPITAKTEIGSQSSSA